MKHSKRILILVLVAAAAVALYWWRKPTAGNATAENEVTIILGAEPVTLDPILMTEVFSATMGNACHSPLVRILPNGEVLWELASSITLNAEATEAKITLKTGCGFWDGSPVTAEDVAYSLKRLQDSASPLKLVAERIATMKAESETVLAVLFSAPEPEFVKLMAHLQAAIVKKGSDKTPGKPLASNLIGAGAFMPGEFESGATYRFKRNPGFPGGGNVASLRFIVKADSQSQLGAMRAGEADILRLRGSLLKETMKESSTDGKELRPDFSSFTVTKAAACELNLVIFNWASPTFAKVAVEDRKKMLTSLSAALDRQGLAKVFVGAEPTNKVIPSAAWNFPPPPPASGTAANWKELGSFELISSTDPASREMAAQTSEFLGKAGASCTTRQLDPTRLIEAIFGGKYDATVITFEMPPPGPLPWLLFWVPGPFSAFGKALPDLVPEIAAARGEVDAEKRQKAWDQLFVHLEEANDVWLPMASRPTVVLHRSNLDGIKIDAAGTPFWSHLSLSK